MKKEEGIEGRGGRKFREGDFYVTLVRLTCDNGFDTKERDDAMDERRRLVFVSSSCTIDERIYSSRNSCQRNR